MLASPRFFARIVYRLLARVRTEGRLAFFDTRPSNRLAVYQAACKGAASADATPADRGSGGSTLRHLRCPSARRCSYPGTWIGVSTLMAVGPPDRRDGFQKHSCHTRSPDAGLPLMPRSALPSPSSARPAGPFASPARVATGGRPCAAAMRPGVNALSTEPGGLVRRGRRGLRWLKSHRSAAGAPAILELVPSLAP
jgi:hypothetical protein